MKEREREGYLSIYKEKRREREREKERERERDRGGRTIWGSDE